MINMEENSVSIVSLCRTMLSILNPKAEDGWNNYPVYVVLKNGDVIPISTNGMYLVPHGVSEDPEWSQSVNTGCFDGGLFLKEL